MTEQLLFRCYPKRRNTKKPLLLYSRLLRVGKSESQIRLLALGVVMDSRYALATKAPKTSSTKQTGTYSLVSSHPKCWEEPGSVVCKQLVVTGIAIPVCAG